MTTEQATPMIAPRPPRWHPATPVAAFAVPSVFSFAFALLGDYRPEVCAIIGGFFLVAALVVRGFQRVIPSVEWALNRRMADFVARMTIQSGSFDTVWGEIKVQLAEVGHRLDEMGARVRHLEDTADEARRFRARLTEELEARKIHLRLNDV